MASNARIKCKYCAFRHAGKPETTLSTAPCGESSIAEVILPPIVIQPGAAVASSPLTQRWALASLSLSVLLSSLGTSIANVALPTLAQAFDASFSQVQWIVLAYLLAITTLIVSVGRLGDLAGRRRCSPESRHSRWPQSAVGAAPTLGLLIAARAAQGLRRGDHDGADHGPSRRDRAGKRRDRQRHGAARHDVGDRQLRSAHRSAAC